MSWGSIPEDYICKDCKKTFKFEMDTLFIAFHGGLPIKCPKCKSTNVEKQIANKI